MESSFLSSASQIQPDEKFGQLLSMGYPAHQCTKALQVAEGDLEQAVEYLLMGDGSQQAFHYSATEMFSDGGADATAQTAEAPQIDQENEDFVSRRGSFTFSLQSTHRCETPLPRSPQVQLEEFLLIMGYSEDEITQALRVAEGDLEQAINFLLMGKSRQGFLLDVEHFSSEHSVQRNNMNISTGCGLGSDNPVTHIVQRVMTDGTNDIRALRTNIATTRPPSSNPLPYTGPKSKIVSTQSFLNVSAAGPFCTCFAGSRFLDGGVVAAPFLNSIMESGIELYRKTNRPISIDKALNKYGKSHFRIRTSKDPKKGMHMENDFQHETSIRKLFANCRNEQEVVWQVVLLEVVGDSFCICLPPKGSGGKFWFFDFSYHSNVRTRGAYALVHSSLLQMDETVESVVGSIGRREGIVRVPFSLYCVQKQR